MELFQLFGRIAIDNTEANQAINDTTNNARESESEQSKAFQKIGATAKKIGTGMLTIGAAIGGAFIGAVEGTREYRTEMAKLDTAFVTNGHSSETAKKTYSDLNAVLGDSGQAVEASNHLALLTDNEKDLQTWTDICTGVYATFGDTLPIEGLTEAANETAKVGQVTGPLADALNWAGISEDEFNEKLEKCSNEQERQKLIMDTLNGTYKDASSQYKETNKDVIDANKANEKLSDAMAKLGEVGEPIMTIIKNAIAGMAEKAIPTLENLGNKIQDLIKWFSENEEKVKLWAGVIGIAAATAAGFVLVLAWSTIMTQAAKAIEIVTIAVKALNLAMKANIIGLVVTAILGLVAAFIYLWNNCEPFRQFWIDLWELIQLKTKVAVEAVKKWWKNMSDDMKEKFTAMKQKATEIFENIKSTISNKVQAAKDLASSAFTKLKTNIISPIVEAKNKVVETFGTIYSTIKEKIEGARDKVDSAIKKIKGFFPLSIGKIFSNLKIPSISVSGGKAPYGIAGKGSLPSFSVNWNAKGGIFDEPTVLPTLSGWQGFGEEGAEAVIPLERNTEWIDKIADRLNKVQNLDSIINRLNQIILQLDELVNMKIYLDSNVLVGELAPALDRKLGSYSIKKIRGNI